MTFLARLACYVVLVGGLSYALASGAIWLARPDPSFRAEAHVAPVPPRIAESIARKRQPLPVVDAARTPATAEPAQVSVPVPRAEPAVPPMKEANAALESVPLPPVRHTRVPVRSGAATGSRQVLAAPEPATGDEAPRPAPVRISTARTDFPY